MAELVQGQGAPVGMKAEGFVDALHRVRQVCVQLEAVREAGGAGRAWPCSGCSWEEPGCQVPALSGRPAGGF